METVLKVFVPEFLFWSSEVEPCSAPLVGLDTEPEAEATAETEAKAPTEGASQGGWHTAASSACRVPRAAWGWKKAGAHRASHSLSLF